MIELLHFLEQDPACKRSQLAESLGVSPSTVSTLLTRAERRGLLSRDDGLVQLDDKAIHAFLLATLPDLIIAVARANAGASPAALYRKLDGHQYIPRETFDEVIERLRGNYTLVGNKRSLYLNLPPRSGMVATPTLA